MRRVVLTFIALVSTSSFAEITTSFNMNQAFPTYSLNCGMAKKDGKFFAIHVENESTCSDLGGAWSDISVHAND